MVYMLLQSASFSVQTLDLLRLPPPAAVLPPPSSHPPHPPPAEPPSSYPASASTSGRTPLVTSADPSPAAPPPTLLVPVPLRRCGAVLARDRSGRREPKSSRTGSRPGGSVLRRGRKGGRSGGDGREATAMVRAPDPVGLRGSCGERLSRLLRTHD